MTVLTPEQTAEVLSVSAPTLRRWASQFEEFLSADAKPGRGRRRTYTVEDVAFLRSASGLLRSHSVEKVKALLRVPTENTSTTALETLTVTDLISEAKSLRDLVSRYRGDVVALTEKVTAQQAELETLHSEFQQFATRQAKQRRAQETELAEIRSQLAELTARRVHWWARLRG